MSTRRTTPGRSIFPFSVRGSAAPNTRRRGISYGASSAPRTGPGVPGQVQFLWPGQQSWLLCQPHHPARSGGTANRPLARPRSPGGPLPCSRPRRRAKDRRARAQDRAVRRSAVGVSFVLRGYFGTSGSANLELDQIGKSLGEFLRVGTLTSRSPSSRPAHDRGTGRERREAGGYHDASGAGDGPPSSHPRSGRVALRADVRPGPPLTPWPGRLRADGPQADILPRWPRIHGISNGRACSVTAVHCLSALRGQLTWKSCLPSVAGCPGAQSPTGCSARSSR